MSSRRPFPLLLVLSDTLLSRPRGAGNALVLRRLSPNRLRGQRHLAQAQRFPAGADPPGGGEALVPGRWAWGRGTCSASWCGREKLQRPRTASTWVPTVLQLRNSQTDVPQVT